MAADWIESGDGASSVAVYPSERARLIGRERLSVQLKVDDARYIGNWSQRRQF